MLFKDIIIFFDCRYFVEFIGYINDCFVVFELYVSWDFFIFFLFVGFESINEFLFSFLFFNGGSLCF